MAKLTRIGQIIPEEALCKKLGLPPPSKSKEGKPRSRTVSSLISQGLKYGEIGGRRYFLEADVVEFFDQKIFETTD